MDKIANDILNLANKLVAGRNKQAKGAMGKIRQHAKSHGKKAFAQVIADLDEVVDGSRQWNDVQKDLFWREALEEIQTRVNKELR